MMENFILKIVLLMLFIIYASGVKILSNGRPMGLQDRIVGGMNARIEDYPWQASLQNDEFMCGAIILSENWFLTAGHCGSGSNFTIRVGTTRYYEGGIERNVTKVIINNNYNAEINDFDFALVKIDEPLIFSTKIKPVILADENERLADRTKCTTSGWGTKDFSSMYPSSTLQSVNVRIVNHALCECSYIKVNVTITNQTICAGFWWGGKDACSGDSGSGLVCESSQNRGWRKLYGVVSSGYGCAKPYYPGIYARVQSVRSWIRETTGV